MAATTLGSLFNSVSTTAYSCLTKACSRVTSDPDVPVIISELFQAGLIGVTAYEGTSECLELSNVQNWNPANVLLLTIATAAGTYKCFQIRVPGNFRQKSLGLMLSSAGLIKGLLIRKIFSNCHTINPTENEGICSHSCMTNNALPFVYMIFAALNTAYGIQVETGSETIEV